MKSRRTSIRSRACTLYCVRQSEGFAVIETSVVIGLFAMLIVLGLILSMDVWRSSSIRSESDLVLSLLYKARSRAMSNIKESDHGLYIDTGASEYVIFEGESYAAAANKLPFEMDDNFSFSGDTEIVFSARTGETEGHSLSISGQGKTKGISINTEGGITWQ